MTPTWIAETLAGGGGGGGGGGDDDDDNCAMTKVEVLPILRNIKSEF